MLTKEYRWCGHLLRKIVVLACKPAASKDKSCTSARRQHKRHNKSENTAELRVVVLISISVGYRRMTNASVDAPWISRLEKRAVVVQTTRETAIRRLGHRYGTTIDVCWVVTG